MGKTHSCIFIKLKILEKLIERALITNNEALVGQGSIKVGVNMKAVFWLGIVVLMEISRLRFKQSRISNVCSSQIYLCFRPFCKFFGDF